MARKSKAQKQNEVATMGTHYLIVTPHRLALAQRPAVHLCEAGSKRTLCGKLADVWLLDNWNGTFRPELASCLTCKRIYSIRFRRFGHKPPASPKTGAS